MTKAKSGRILSLILSLIMLVSAFAMVGVIEANAASMARTTVSLSNTSATTVKVSWTKVTGAKKYTVYRSTSKTSGFKAVKTTTSLSFSSTGLTCGKTYYFKVKAINGTKYSTSYVKSIKLLPLKVTSPKLTKGCTFLKTSWNKSNGASGYEVYYCPTKNGTFKRLASTTNLYYKNTGLKLGTTRYYKIRAYKVVNSKKVYGAFSSIIGGKSYTAHEPSTSWTITKKPTCKSTGTKTNICAYCNKQYSVVIPADSSLHQYVKSTVSASKNNCPFSRYTCKICGDVYDSTKKTHKYSSVVTAPTCTKGGYTTYTCTRDGCGYTYKGNNTSALGHDYEWVEVKPTCTEQGYLVERCKTCNFYNSKDFDSSKDPLGHSYGEEYETDEKGYRYHYCTVCNNREEPKIDYTCYIDLTNQTVSVPAVAEFNSSSTAQVGVIDKLDLNPDGISSYEITGSAENLTIDVNSDVYEQDVEVKLNNASIVNEAKDCFDIKNKSTATDELGEIIVPWVAVSVKDGTENLLKTNTSGNAIETACKLELKGHGVLNMDTASTSISSKAKIEIKNVTLNIKSANRGIDTKNDILNASGLIQSTEYSNIEIKPNAVITINSADDGIRCKNMTVLAVEEGTGDVGPIIKITAGSDGIQLEGKTGFQINSGEITISAGKYAFNCSASIIAFNNGVSKDNCTGATAFSKA